MDTWTRIKIVVIFGAMAGFAFFYLLPRSFVDPGKWPITRGTIVRAEIGRDMRGRDPADTSDFFLRVTYAYEVAGVELENNSASLIDGSIATSFQQESLERLKASEYQVGQSVRVYYDPKNPKRAVLDTAPVSTARRTAFVLMGIAGCIGILAGLFGKPVTSSRSASRRQQVPIGPDRT